MKKTLKPKKLKLDKATLRVLTTNDLQDIAGGTNTTTGTARCTIYISYCDDCA
jgi:hypothetical protein